MLSQSEKKLVYDSIPKIIVVENFEFKPTTLYANQYFYDTFPAVVLNYPFTRLNFMPLNKVRSIEIFNDEEHDSIVAASSLSYKLSVGFVTSLVKVTGTKDGVSFVFDLDKITIGDAQTITFKIDERPDVGTTFKVDFEFKMFRLTKGGIFDDVLSVNVYAQNLRQATWSIPGAKIVEGITNRLKLFFDYEFSVDGIIGWVESDVRNLDAFLESEYRFRRQFDVFLRHKETHITEVPPFYRAIITYTIPAEIAGLLPSLTLFPSDTLYPSDK